MRIHHQSCFNPRTPCGVRHKRRSRQYGRQPCFNPRTPCGVRRNRLYRRGGNWWFQSTHSLRSATMEDKSSCQERRVSIHALLAECDTLKRKTTYPKTGFNPRTPCGVRLAGQLLCAGFRMVSIHALLAECDASGYNTMLGLDVSIHALLAECDARLRCNWPLPAGFNPRTPCGVRPSLYNHFQSIQTFQSTHSLRSATGSFRTLDDTVMVSIHALLAECDIFAMIANFQYHGFNPRTPCGVRLAAVLSECIDSGFQSTHSLRSATLLSIEDGDQHGVSIHALLAECDLSYVVDDNMQERFNPRTPCGVRPPT